MSHYLVGHAEGDWRVHADNGTEPLSTGWNHRPTVNEITEQAAEDGPGGSLLGRSDLRSLFVDAVSGGIVYRDLTRDGETVPWQ
jgi:hypothetical protein